MTLSELEQIKSQADSASHHANRAKHAQEWFAGRRKSLPEENAYQTVRNSIDSTRQAFYRQELMSAIDRWMPDILREVELKLMADERRFRNEQRRLQAQLDAYLTDD